MCWVYIDIIAPNIPNIPNAYLEIFLLDCLITKKFQNFYKISAKFQVFPGLYRTLFKFQDFPGLSKIGGNHDKQIKILQFVTREKIQTCWT